MLPRPTIILSLYINRFPCPFLTGSQSTIRPQIFISHPSQISTHQKICVYGFHWDPHYTAFSCSSLQDIAVQK